ncbi:uncharacterized protein LOC135816614 [Sycon ciliatum]|uniref:uncharacterized protein LOC135816614 n=1 Tax=Sycon ciliatum TaxID=27933 RepID=UPI0031F61F56
MDVPRLKGPSMPLGTFLKWHELPAKVQVTSGYSAPDDEEDSLSSGEVIDLHGVTIGEVVLSVDHRNQRQTLPLHQKCWFEILTDNPGMDDKIFESVSELLCATMPLPNQVRVLESVDTGDELSTLYVEDILTIVRVSKEGLVVTNQLLEEMTLPPDLKCKFTPQLDQKWYTMQDLVAFKLSEFPIRVRLTGAVNGSARRGPTYTLEDVRQEANVLAQVNKELVAIPLDIDVTVALVDGRMLAQCKSKSSGPH